LKGENPLSRKEADRLVNFATILTICFEIPNLLNRKLFAKQASLFLKWIDLLKFPENGKE
jgi:hypothetical protein